MAGRLGFLVPTGGGVVLLLRGVIGGALPAPGEGDVDALDRDKELREDVEEGELESEIEIEKLVHRSKWETHSVTYVQVKPYLMQFAIKTGHD